MYFINYIYIYIYPDAYGNPATVPWQGDDFRGSTSGVWLPFFSLGAVFLRSFGHLWRPFGAPGRPERCKTPFRCSFCRPLGSFGEPGGAQESPRERPGAPKCSKRRPKSSKRRPKWSKKAPKAAPETHFEQNGEPLFSCDSTTFLMVFGSPEGARRLQKAKKNDPRTRAR